MTDQAEELRRLASSDLARIESAVAVTGGKGGIGKSHVAVNLALAWQQNGLRVLLVDADLSLANLDVLLRINPRETIRAAVGGETPLEECIFQVSAGLDLLPAASGSKELASLSDEQREQLFSDLAKVSAGYDAVLIDTPAGIAPETMDFLATCAYSVVVTTPEPTAITDAYALLKVLHGEEPEARAGLVVNMAAGLEEANRVGAKLRCVVRRFLEREIAMLGWIPRDGAVIQAARDQKPLLLGAPRSLAAGALRHLAARVREEIKA